MTITSDLSQFSQLQYSHIEGAVTSSDEIGIQWKQRSTLQELLESQPGRDALEKLAQTKLPPPPPVSTYRVDPINHKKKREEKGKEVMEMGKNVPPKEVEPQRGAKQQRGLQTRSATEAERRGDHEAVAPI